MADEKSQDTGAKADDDLDKIMKEISSLEAETESPAEKPVAAVVHKLELKPEVKMETKKENSEQSLKLELTGTLKLKLSFASGSRGIDIICSDDALICQLADGTEFRVPTVVTKKKVA
jgi:hypothetical protein